MLFLTRGDMDHLSFGFELTKCFFAGVCQVLLRTIKSEYTIGAGRQLHLCKRSVGTADGLPELPSTPSYRDKIDVILSAKVEGLAGLAICFWRVFDRTSHLGSIVTQRHLDRGARTAHADDKGLAQEVGPAGQNGGGKPNARFNTHAVSARANIWNDEGMFPNAFHWL